MRWWEAISDRGYYRRYHLKTINTFPEILSGYSLSINHPRLLRDPPARTHKLYRLGTEQRIFLDSFPRVHWNKLSLGQENICSGAQRCITDHLSPMAVSFVSGSCHKITGSGVINPSSPERTAPRPRESDAALWPLKIVSEHPSPDSNYNNGVRAHLLCHCQRLPLL